MMSGKCHHDPLIPRRGQLAGPDRTVEAIPLHLARNRQPDTVEHGGDRTSHGSQAGVTFADVVEQRRPVGLVVSRQDGGDAGSDVEGMALIGGALCPEQLGGATLEPIVNPLLLIRGQSLRGHVTKESLDEMPDVTENGYDAFLQSTQRVEVGRNSIRACPISLPHTSQVP